MGMCLFVGSAVAATISIPVAIGAGANITGTVDLTDNAGDIDVTLTVQDGDIRGFWFSLDGVETGVVGTSPPVSDVCYYNPEAASLCGGGNVMSGAGAVFEYAFDLGNPGGNDIGTTVSFTLSADQDLTIGMFLNGFVGIRVQGIDEERFGEGSAKLVASCSDGECGEGPPQEIPEPSTWMMLATGAGLMILAKRGR
jgi:hypothetical protein